MKQQQDELPRIKNKLNAHLFPKDNEQNKMASASIPSQAMTVKQMLHRHAAGLPIDQSKGAQYLGGDPIPNINNMDLIDRQAYIDQVADALVDVRNRVAMRAKTEKEKSILDEVDRLFKERIALLKNSKDTVTDLPIE